VPANAAQPIDPELASPSAYLGVLGMPGLTAYVGLFDIAGLKDGEAVFVSGAAGAVGSLAGQLAKVHGCRVVGSAGSPEKVAFLKDELGFDAAFNYKDGSVHGLLREAAPDGIDVYFDNVGGEHLEAALVAMHDHGRVAMCGAISMYNATEAPPGPRSLPLAVRKRLTLRGFIVSDHFDRMEAFATEVGGLLRDGRIRYRETVVEGLDRAPEAFIGLLHGQNLGKMVVKL
jgi:NADPH-dependent curcumin reductase CurA